jgi:hypothetical protein
LPHLASFIASLLGYTYGRMYICRRVVKSQSVRLAAPDISPLQEWALIRN